MNEDYIILLFLVIAPSIIIISILIWVKMTFFKIYGKD